jgi:dolichyl-phosphate beta-glucosyltransferase
MPRSSVLVVLPVYNEQSVAPRVAQEIMAFAQAHPHYLMRVVDDGSNDGTAEAFEHVLKSCPNAEVLALPKNEGKGRAVHLGFKSATQDFLLFTDGDLAYSLDHLEELVKCLKKHEVAIGSRHMAKQHSPNLRCRRKITGWVFNRMVRFLFGLSYPDTQAGLKGFQRRIAEEIFKRRRANGFSFDAELLFIARKLGYAVGEIPATVTKEHRYKFSSMKIAMYSLHSFWEILNVIWGDLRGLYD